MLDFSALLNTPFTVSDLLVSSFSLLQVVGPYVLIGMAITFVPRLIRLIQATTKEEPKKKGRRSGGNAVKKSNNNKISVQKAEKETKPKRVRNKYKAISREEIYNYEKQRRSFSDLAKSSLDTRQKIFYEGKALEIRSKVMKRHGIVLA